MEEIVLLKNTEQFKEELKRLAEIRKGNKNKAPRTVRLSKLQRADILAKTGSKCHICGVELEIQEFEADHVKSHSSGGSSLVDNFLPACKTCNNYRWHYGPEELQWILKLGVWARTQIQQDTKIGKTISESFMKKELIREGRRRSV